MGYSPFSEPPAGEICIRGPALFTGYYNQPELTKECMGEWSGGGRESGP